MNESKTAEEYKQLVDRILNDADSSAIDLRGVLDLLSNEVNVQSNRLDEAYIDVEDTQETLYQLAMGFRTVARCALVIEKQLDVCAEHMRQTVELESAVEGGRGPSLRNECESGCESDAN